MRAVTCRRYGPPDMLRVEDVPTPSPGPGQVLVRVRASTVTSGDARIRGFRGPTIFWLPLRLAFGLRRPRQPVMGMEFAGEVVALGAGAGRFRPGEAVFGMALGGANAEFLAIAEDAAIAPLPGNLSAEEAAALPFGALAALDFLRDVARVRAGERVLVVGAAGAVGVAAVQLARHFGAEVTGLCSAENLDLVAGLGAARVLDRARTDIWSGEEGYDVVLDTVGVTRVAELRRVLSPGGRHVFLSYGHRELLAMLGSWRPFGAGRARRVLCGYSAGRAADLRLVAGWAESGVLRPVIGHRFTLTEAVAAHRLVDSGRKRGALVLTIDGA